MSGIAASFGRTLVKGLKYVVITALVLGLIFGIVLAVDYLAFDGKYVYKAIFGECTGEDNSIPLRNYDVCAEGDEAEDNFVKNCGDTWLLKEYGTCGCGRLPDQNIAAWEDTINQPDQDTRYIRCLANRVTFANYARCRCSCNECYKDYCEDNTSVSYWTRQCKLLFDIIT